MVSKGMRGCLGLCLALLLAGCFSFVSPENATLVASPAKVEIAWSQKEPIQTLKVRLDGVDISDKFQIYDPDRGATATLVLPVGKHNLQAEGTFFQTSIIGFWAEERTYRDSVDFTVPHIVNVPKEVPKLPVELK